MPTCLTWGKMLGSSWGMSLGLDELEAVLGTSEKVNLGGMDSSLGDRGEGSILYLHSEIIRC